jgi:DNA-binding MarR family transcriptional regulator
MTVACVARKAPPGKKRKLVLEQFAPYRIVALGHVISDRLSRVYRDENITIPEWRVLAVIGEADRVAARDVVRRTPMDKMTVSRAVASLEAKGFVHRTPDEGDRRVSSLSLSEKGRALFERIAALALSFEDDLLSTLEPEEAAAFRAVLEKLEARAMASEDV